MGGSTKGQFKNILPSWLLGGKKLDVAHKIKQFINYSTFIHTPKITYEKGIADTSCTSHYLKTNSVINHRIHAPIQVKQPDGSHITSKNKGEIPILGELPQHAKSAHGFNELQTNLLSIGQLCDSNCIALFDKRKCRIIHNNKTVISGDRNHQTGLWEIPFNTSKGHLQGCNTI